MEYYNNSYYATPVAMSLLKLAKEAGASKDLLNATLTDLLWIASVSLTGYLDAGLIPECEYRRMIWEELKEDLDAGVGTFNDLPAGEGDDALNGSQGDVPRAPPMGSMVERRLILEEDLRLTLYKHWNLEDSMNHSSYFHGAMELSRDKGKRALKNFFVSAGVPPTEYRQLFSEMNLRIRQNLIGKFKKSGRNYGLVEEKMLLQQFVRKFGNPEDGNSLFLHEISSADAAHIVSSILSAVPNSLSGSSLEHLPQNEDGILDNDAIVEMERQANEDNFYRAYDAVLCKDREVLKGGMAEAQDLVEHVRQLAGVLKDSKALHSTRQFRWCKIEQPPQACFRHPLALRRLAVWLLDVLYRYRPKSSADDVKPLLVMIKDRVRSTYVCVGSTPLQSLGDNDQFSNKFSDVTSRSDSFKYRYNFFDRSCIEIAADDFDRFMEILCNSSAR